MKPFDNRHSHYRTKEMLFRFHATAIQTAIPRLVRYKMHNRTRGLRWHAGHSDQVKHRQALRKRSGNGADGAQFTYAIGRVNRADSVGASVPVSGVGGIQFVAASHPFDSSTPGKSTMASSTAKA